MQLVQSRVVQGGICAIVLASQSSRQLPSSVEVPVGRDVFLTAIGGNGEDGMNGEDGESGLNGADGIDASETSDATVRMVPAILVFSQLTRRKAGSNAGHGGKCVIPSIL